MIARALSLESLRLKYRFRVRELEAIGARSNGAGIDSRQGRLLNKAQRIIRGREGRKSAEQLASP